MKNNAINTKDLPFITYILFFITSISFFLQPLLIRPFGIPLSFTMLLVLNLVLIFNVQNVKINEIIYLTTIGTILLAVDLYTPPELFRGFIFINMLLFTYLCSKFSITKQQSSVLWSSVLIICFSLSVIGLKRWLFGYSVENTENETGIAENIKTYFYLGISYMNSTRNTDAFYFGVPLILSFMHYKNKLLKFKFLFLVVLLITSFCVLASLSRGIILSILIAYVLATRAYVINKNLYKYLIYLLGIIFFIYVFYDNLKALPGVEFVVNLTVNGFISLFNPLQASYNLDSGYTYSNDERIRLYAESINTFLEFPFGLGVDNIPPGRIGNDKFILHSENVYLDFLISLGIFSIPCFLFIFDKLKNLYNLSKYHFESKKLYFLLIYILLYSLFCSATDLYYYWFILSLICMEYNSFIPLKRK